MRTDKLSFTPAMTLTDAEYQAAADRVTQDRVVIAAEARGEHVLIAGKPEKPECKNIRNCEDWYGACIYYEADPQPMHNDYLEVTK